MENKKPLILISNDDGYHSVGIRSLVEMMKPIGDILVCAPESARSGYATAFSAAEPLLLKRRHNMGETEVWSCTGTPVDCVKIALDQLCRDRRPDLILGGINHGDNSSVNNHYSGTMGVAYEGCMKYIPSIAFSNCNYDETAPQDHLTEYVRKIASMVLRNGLPKGVCLNVNFPNRKEFLGIKVCRMTYGSWTQEVDKRRHLRGYDYYWMIGKYVNDEPDAEDTDQWAINHGYVAITPTTIDVTAYSYMEKLRGQLGIL